jgi:hypothetical protein
MRIFASNTACVAGIVLLEVEVVPMRQSTVRSQKPGVSFETVEHAAPQLRLTQGPRSDPDAGEQSGGFRKSVLPVLICGVVSAAGAGYTVLSRRSGWAGWVDVTVLVSAGLLMIGLVEWNRRSCKAER